MPRIAFSLSVLILIILSTTFSQDEHTANYRITENDLDGQFFQSERAGEHHSTFYFYDGEMGVIPQNPLILDPEEVDESIRAEERLNKKIYPNISVKTEGTSYFVYSNNELIVTFEKIAPRIVVDKNGNRYSTSLYLSKEYELQFVNQSSIDLSNLELAINDESYTIPKTSFLMAIPFHSTFLVIIIHSIKQLHWMSHLITKIARGISSMEKLLSHSH